jgi:hypothetical protein
MGWMTCIRCGERPLIHDRLYTKIVHEAMYEYEYDTLSHITEITIVHFYDVVLFPSQLMMETVCNQSVTMLVVSISQFVVDEGREL